MRVIRLTVLIGILAIAGGGSMAGPQSTWPPDEITVQHSSEGLVVEAVDGNGQTIGAIVLEEWNAVAKSFTIKDRTQQGLTVTEHLQDGRAITLISNDSFCSIWERPEGEPAMSIEFLPAIGGDEIVLTRTSEEDDPPYGWCGGCLTSWNSVADWDAWTCVGPAEGSCTICRWDPCPPPPPPPPPGGNPDCYPGSEDFPWCMENMCEIYCDHLNFHIN